MSRLVWNAEGARKFEVGVDRGVLYVDGQGVVWNGLVSVDKSVVGGEVVPFHIDGVKYLNHVKNEEFQGKIAAFTYPDEFAVCDGTIGAGNGLYVTHQKKKPFSLCYRTKIGNDIDGVEHGYKLHLVYNVTASPTEQAHNTINATVSPFNFEWDIFTKPVLLEAHQPTAHLVVEADEVPSDLLEQLEDILYGTDTEEPRLPTALELMFMFQEYDPSILDAGYLTETYYATFDAGDISESYTDTIDGGSP